MKKEQTRLRTIIKRVRFPRMMEGFTILKKDGQIVGIYGRSSMDAMYFWYAVDSEDGALCASADRAQYYILHPKDRPDAKVVEEEFEIEDEG